MADDISKWIEGVTKLTKLTQDGELTWSSAPSDDILISDDTQQIESVFTANYRNKKLRLYKKRFKVEPPDPPLGAIVFTSPRIFSDVTGSAVKKYPYWNAQIYLELLDYYGHILWSFPEVSALRDLLTSVKYQVSGIEDLLDDLLEQEA